MEQLVSYSGPWQESDRKAVTEAIEEYEAARKSPLPSGTYGSPWICSCYPSERNTYLFTASRFQSATALTAYSAAELAERIRNSQPAGLRRAS